jgi:hypothetical protein
LPSESRKILGERIFASLNNFDDFVSMRTEICPTLSARQMRIIFEPSARPFRLMRALRAQDTEWLIVEHGLNPETEAAFNS